MSIYDRPPYFDGQRERDRGYRERTTGSDRRRYGRRHEDDDRGAGMARERDELDERGGFRTGDPYESRERRQREHYEPDYPRNEGGFGRERRFEDFEDWERPHQMSPQSQWGHRSSYGGGYAGTSDYRRRGYGGSPDSSFGQGWFESRGRYAGRGPKGYQRSDERLKEDVCDRLTADPDIDASEIQVTVQGGEVTVEGTVRERQMKRAVEDCIESVSGVQQVHNRLRVEASEDGDEIAGRFTSKSSNEGQRSSAGRKAH